MSMEELDSNLQELKECFVEVVGNKTKLDRCLVLVEKLKLLLSEFHTRSDENLSELLLKTRDILEIGALLSVENKDTEAFKNYYSQLQPIYFDFNLKSDKTTTILSVWMLHLISENRIGDLYILMERIPQDILKDEKISYVIDLEKNMMEGDFFQLINNEFIISCDYFKTITNTTRNKIAASIELAYKKLQIKHAIKLLKLQNEQELMSFMSYYNQYKLQQYPDSYTWRVIGDTIQFQNDVPLKHEIPSRELLYQSLEYTKELEKIV